MTCRVRLAALGAGLVMAGSGLVVAGPAQAAGCVIPAPLATPSPSPSPGVSDAPLEAGFAGTVALPEATPHVQVTAAEPAPAPATDDECGTPARVTTAAELTAALGSAGPGAVIELADGVYEGRFVLSAQGTVDAPIVVRGSPRAVLDGGDVSEGYTLHLDGTAHAVLEGFSVRGGQKGVVLDGATDVVMAGMDLSGTGMEVVHFRSGTTGSLLAESRVHDSGLDTPGFGEGVYVGSAKSNGQYADESGSDRSDDNMILGNEVFDTTSEPVDVKEGTTGTTVRGNFLDARKVTGAHYGDSAVDLKGNGADVSGNRIVGAADGVQTHVQLDGWGNGNRVTGNVIDVPGTEVLVDPESSGTVVSGNG